MKKQHSLDKLMEIIAKLRSPEGCPWDKEQTSQSLKPYLVEETYEVLEAIDEADVEKLKEEIGDLITQILMHVQLATEKNMFNIEDVLECACNKLIRRHPHVFGDIKLNSSKEVMIHWEAIKRREKGISKEDISSDVLNSIPKNLPSLLFAHCVQDKVERTGHEWNTPDRILDELENILGILKRSYTKSDNNISEIEDIIGIILFNIVLLARIKNIDAEGILRRKVRQIAEELIT
jgi:tetrapyrrole methylase family protein/MazG family protein